MKAARIAKYHCSGRTSTAQYLTFRNSPHESLFIGIRPFGRVGGKNGAILAASLRSAQKVKWPAVLIDIVQIDVELHNVFVVVVTMPVFRIYPGL
jgi:hypothetical protein